MVWGQQSNRSVPTDWHRRKRTIQARDRGICYACGHAGADQVDHKLAVAQGGTHDLDNLGSIHGSACPTCRRRCHSDKTQTEAATARAAQRAKLRHPTERHPGLR